MNVTSKAPNPEKGKRYLAQLDRALCNGSWAEVPELARKTDKHAPTRNCFTLAARTETQIASASHRPTSASSTGTSSIHSLSEAIPKLQEAINNAKSPPDDAYCASVCLAEIHWLQEDVAATLKALPPGSAPSDTTGSLPAPLGWLEVCEVKAQFIKLAALESSGQVQEAENMYRRAITQTPGSRTPELRRWTERLVARACMYNYKKAQPPTLPVLSEALIAFRAWASFWQRAPPPASGSGISPSRIDIPRRQVWKAYYDVLSMILQRELIYNPSVGAGSNLLIMPWSQITSEKSTDARVRQRAELKNVETTYESLLLNETQFPKASETNTEVDEWVEEAVTNWKVLCGPHWTDAELGEGGKEAVGRGMLDILYRAATKTFHSTVILRQLFTVHAALGDFDLAMNAFSSYVEIVDKGKARGEKTGKHELGFDSNDHAVLTGAAALRVLCKYGDREQLEKAMEIIKTVQHWLGQQRQDSPGEPEVNGDNNAGDNQPRVQAAPPTLQLQTLVTAYRAIGVTQAQWARTTYDADCRASLQRSALSNLRQAQSHENSVETSYALARLLAETGHVHDAVQVIKRCVTLQHESAEESDGVDHEYYERQVQLIPVWHLLALCLTARDEYDPAIRMCRVAFDQFGDPEVLFGHGNSQTSTDSEKQTSSSRAVVDAMDNVEKEMVLQVKMSQLKFVELTDGPESAVDMSGELLSMYTRLFGNPEQLKSPSRRPSTVTAPVAPPKSGGALRSIAGSIRPKTPRTSTENQALRRPSSAARLTISTSTGSETNGQVPGAPVSITVTNEDGVLAERGRHQASHHHRHKPFRTRSRHGDSRGLRSKKSRETLHEKPEVNSQAEPPTVSPMGTDVTAQTLSLVNQSNVGNAVQSSMSPDVPTNPQQPLREMEHNAPHDHWPPPPGHEDQPPKQDVRLPAPHPASGSVPLSQFNALQERQHEISVLVSVWLFIAGLYLRADLHDDAHGAIFEAFSLVEAFEAEKRAHNANAQRLFEKGWGGGKSVDELWADVHTAKGELASARGFPFQAMENYDQALLHFPDHPQGIIKIADLLMDIYDEKIPVEEQKSFLELMPTTSSSFTFEQARVAEPAPRRATAKSSLAHPGRDAPEAARNKDPTSAELNRLAARDRAYMLLSNLTKLGSGWDNSEAWYTLARAYELREQVDKAKQALWWVVELEEYKPMRPLKVITPGGYAL